MISNDKIKELMNRCETLAIGAECLRRKVGALIYSEYFQCVLGEGFNKVTQYNNDCKGKGCLRDRKHIKSGTQLEVCNAIHAEQVALMNCLKNGTYIHESAMLFTTHKPCTICAKLIAESGINLVIYKYSYPSEESDEILKKSGVEIVEYKKLLNETSE